VTNLLTDESSHMKLISVLQVTSATGKAWVVPWTFTL